MISAPQKQVHIKDTCTAYMSTHHRDLSALLCQLGVLGRENWYTGVLADGGPDEAAGTEAGAATEAAEIEEAAEAWRKADDAGVPENPLVEVVDLLTILAKVPVEDLASAMGASLLQKVKLTSKKATTIFDEAKFPQRYEVNELWWSTAQGNPEEKANIILEKLLQEAPTNTIESICLPNCMRAHVPNQATKLARILSQCPNLTDLDLSENRIEWREIEKFKTPIKLRNLKVLDLKDCDLDHERYSIFRFFEMVRSWECNNLLYFNLSDNWLGDANIDWRPLLGQLTQLQHLHLSRCGLSWSNIANVTDGLILCKNLTDLDLSCHRLGNFSEEGIHVLYRGLCGLPLLQELNLQFTQIDNDNLTYLARNMPNYRALKNLNISSNRYRNDGVRSLVEMLPQCTTLTQLDMGGNHIFGETVLDLVRAGIEMSRREDHQKILLNLSGCVLEMAEIRDIRALRRSTECYVHMVNQNDRRLWFD
jgi:Ran GTPase-activating protein (RanGAP) involved in mRNA processing and transport